MFRLMRVRPPNGWEALAWELAVVIAGVLIALFVQELADQRSWRSRAAVARERVREDLAQHLLNALHYRLVEPCVDAQLERLHRRLSESGDRLVSPQKPPYPNPVVIRAPYKAYPMESWDAALSDGVAAHFSAHERSVFQASRSQGQVLTEKQDELVRLIGQLNSFQRPLALTPEVILQLGTRIDDARNVNRITGLISGQVARRLSREGFRLTPDQVKRLLQDRGTAEYCRSERLPLRSIEELTVQERP